MIQSSEGDPGREGQAHSPRLVQMRDVHFISALSAHYETCTLSRGGRLPILDAMSGGSPPSCPGRPVSREQATDAMPSSDPRPVDRGASALARPRRDEVLQEGMRLLGRQDVSQRTWDPTAWASESPHRKLDNGPFSGEDEVHPRRAGQHWGADSVAGKEI